MNKPENLMTSRQDQLRARLPSDTLSILVSAEVTRALSGVRLSAKSFLEQLASTRGKGDRFLRTSQHSGQIQRISSGLRDQTMNHESPSPCER